MTYLRTFGVYLSSSHRMSSVVTTRMFGPSFAGRSAVATTDGGGAWGIADACSARPPPVGPDPEHAVRRAALASAAASRLIPASLPQGEAGPVTIAGAPFAYECWLVVEK